MRQTRFVKDSLLVVFIIFLDQFLKQYLLMQYLLGASFPLYHVGPIELLCTLTTNQGAAWGICSTFPQELLYFRVLVLIFLFSLWYYYRENTWMRVSLACIIAGALSNIGDTLYRGYVIDMMHLRLWGWSYPIFNFADVAICLGALSIGLYGLFFDKKLKKH
jgi:signal peptidase II